MGLDKCSTSQASYTEANLCKAVADLSHYINVSQFRG